MTPAVNVAVYYLNSIPVPNIAGPFNFKYPFLYSGRLYRGALGGVGPLYHLCGPPL